VTENSEIFAEYARLYSQLGWALVPCIGKAPKDRAWPQAKPLEPEHAAGMWSRWGATYNLGIVCGPSGLAVIDVDLDDADQALFELLGTDKLPQTPVVRTGSGRLQVYYRDPGGLTKTTRDGFELRVAAHHCIAPPSLHPDTGRPYTWLAGHEPSNVRLVELPQRAIDFFAPSPSDGSRPVPAVGGIIPAGARNTTLTSLAGTMRHRGMGEEEILAALRVTNGTRCQPPLDPAEVEDIARSVGRYAPAAAPVARGTASGVLRAATLETGGASARWLLRPFSQGEVRQVRWLVPGLIPLRFLTLVAGIGGLGKSTWVLSLAAQGSVAEEPWDTIYVTYEDTLEEVLKPRLLAAGGDTSRVHELVAEDADALDSLLLPRDVAELQALVRSVSAKLVVIDPVVAAVEKGLDAYKDQHVRQVLAQLWRVSREENCALALIGHLNRLPSTDAYLRIANSLAFWNACRSVVLITEDGDAEDGRRLVAQRKSNLGPLAPIQRHKLEEIVLPDVVDPVTGKSLVTSRMRFIEIADDVERSDTLGAQRTSKTERAKTVLEQLLADGGWHESDRVKKLIGSSGISDRTVERAASEIGVEHERRDFPASTWWRLPQGATSPGARVASDPVAPRTGAEVGATGDPPKPRGSRGSVEPVAPSDETDVCAAAADTRRPRTAEEEPDSPQLPTERPWWEPVPRNLPRSTPDGA
jgi:hypothetical protein